MFKKILNFFKKDKFYTIKDCGTHIKITLHRPVVIDTDHQFVIDSNHMFVINSKLLHENPYKGNKIPYDNETQFEEINNDLVKKYNTALTVQKKLEESSKVYNQDGESTDACPSCVNP